MWVSCRHRCYCHSFMFIQCTVCALSFFRHPLASLIMKINICLTWINSSAMSQFSFFPDLASMFFLFLFLRSYWKYQWKYFARRFGSNEQLVKCHSEKGRSTNQKKNIILRHTFVYSVSDTQIYDSWMEVVVGA